MSEGFGPSAKSEAGVLIPCRTTRGFRLAAARKAGNARDLRQGRASRRRRHPLWRDGAVRGPHRIPVPWTEGFAVDAGGLSNDGFIGIEKDITQSVCGPLCRDTQWGSVRLHHLPKQACQHATRTLRHIDKAWRAQIELEAAEV